MDPIHHRPRHIQFTISRRLEIEAECLHRPPDQSADEARCPDCDCVMVYRGIGRLRSGSLVHYYECVHSPREVHSVSIAIPD